HPHRFGLLRGDTAQGQFFERPDRHRRNLPPVLHGLRRLPASLTVFVIGNIGVIVIRKETQCQGVKGGIVQRLLHPPAQDCHQVTIKCFHIVPHPSPPSPLSSSRLQDCASGHLATLQGLQGLIHLRQRHNPINHLP